MATVAITVGFLDKIRNALIERFPNSTIDASSTTKRIEFRVSQFTEWLEDPSKGMNCIDEIVEIVTRNFYNSTKDSLMNPTISQDGLITFIISVN